MKKILSIAFIFIVLMSLSLTVSAKDYVYAASADGELALYIEPDENSYTVTKVPSCAKLELINKERTWGLVSFENKAGWINLSFTRKSYKTAAEATGSTSEKTVEVISQDKMVNLYSLPTDSAVLGSSIKHTVPEGAILTVTRETPSGWGLVSMNGKYAWVEMKDTQIYKDEFSETEQFSIYYVYALSKDGAGVPLWNNAKEKTVLKVIPDCTRLTVRRENGEMIYVSYDGANGWIEAKRTAASLDVSQLRAGQAANKEYEIKCPEGLQAVELSSIPSDDMACSRAIVGSIEDGEIVYVMRKTVTGWCLINHNGDLGWLPPESAVPSESIHKDKLKMLDILEKGYIRTVEKGAQEAFATPEELTRVAKLPECIEVKKLAQSGDYIYVYSDYAAGWVKGDEIASTYEEAVTSLARQKKTQYMALFETPIYSVPTYLPECVPVQIGTIAEGEFFKVKKVSAFKKIKWGLVEVDGKYGWIDLSFAKNVEKEKTRMIIIALAVFLVIVIALILFFIIKKKKNKKEGKIERENGKDLLDDSCRAQERTADVFSE